MATVASFDSRVVVVPCAGHHPSMPRCPSIEKRPVQATEAPQTKQMERNQLQTPPEGHHRQDEVVVVVRLVVDGDLDVEYVAVIKLIAFAALQLLVAEDAHVGLEQLAQGVAVGLLRDAAGVERVVVATDVNRAHHLRAL